jgi:predicted metal-dependent enzyme (double-stranded beta helix superfamily)
MKIIFNYDETVTEIRQYEYELDEYNIKRFLKEMNYVDDYTYKKIIDIIRTHEDNNTLTEEEDEVYQDLVDWLRGECVSDSPNYTEVIDSFLNDEGFTIYEESKE